MNLINKQVKHTGTLGMGVIIEQDEQYITVEFSSRTSKFLYPAAFGQFLVAVDQDVQSALMDTLGSIEATKAAAKEAEIAKREAEEQARSEAVRSKNSIFGKKVKATKAYKPEKRVDGRPLTYLVFQGDTYNEEQIGQFIWAPKFTKDGRTMHHWERLTVLREGDVIFHCSDGFIRAVSRVKGACEDSARPDSSTGDWTNWEKDGRRVDCEYYVLKTPLKHGAYKEKILEYCNVKYSPFDKDGNGNMGYLYQLNQSLAAFFIQKIAENNPNVVNLDYLKFILVI